MVTLDEKQFKILLKEALTELFEERQELFLQKRWRKSGWQMLSVRGARTIL